VFVEVVKTDELGDRSYVVHDGSTAAVIDPQRDIDRIETVLTERHLSLELVLETHVHNDYVSGGAELARRSGARYCLNAADPVAMKRTGLTDGDQLDFGSIQITAVATPGHTGTHLAYIATDRDQADAPPAVFTGGSLLFGSVGRTDLVDAAYTDELTRSQFHSVRRLADLLPDAAPVFPTHGFGSFCSTGGAVKDPDSTVGAERKRNDALVIDDEDEFVTTLLSNLTAYPAYYTHMAPLNLAGASQPDLDHYVLVTPAELAQRLAGGEWIVDLRDRRAYAADHLAGTISIALGSPFATYVGWLVPWGAPLTLIGNTAEQIREAQRHLARIGIDELSAATGALGDVAPEQPRHSYRRVDFATTAAEMGPGDVLLDVRRDDEYRHGHLDGAWHVPLQDLLTRHGELPDARLWVHCASGYRAGIAASVLDRAGRQVVHIDDDYAHGAAVLSSGGR
jgi:hydroxyacylglutathione hydrolase